jgi:hypothetical protein
MEMFTYSGVGFISGAVFGYLTFCKQDRKREWKEK